MRNENIRPLYMLECAVPRRKSNFVQPVVCNSFKRIKCCSVRVTRKLKIEGKLVVTTVYCDPFEN